MCKKFILDMYGMPDMHKMFGIKLCPFPTCYICIHCSLFQHQKRAMATIKYPDLSPQCMTKHKCPVVSGTESHVKADEGMLVSERRCPPHCAEDQEDTRRHGRPRRHQDLTLVTPDTRHRCGEDVTRVIRRPRVEDNMLLTVCEEVIGVTGSILSVSVPLSLCYDVVTESVTATGDCPRWLADSVVSLSHRLDTLCDEDQLIVNIALSVVVPNWQVVWWTSQEMSLRQSQIKQASNSTFIRHVS